MADGSGGPQTSVQDSLKQIGKDLTVNLAKDMFDQVSPSKTSSANQNQGSSGNPQMQSIQKNIQIANISRKIQAYNQRRKIAQQQAQQKERQRIQTQEEEKKERKEMLKEKAGFGGKVKDIFANWGNTLARRGKGEQRGNKATG